MQHSRQKSRAKLKRSNHCKERRLNLRNRVRKPRKISMRRRENVLRKKISMTIASSLVQRRSFESMNRFRSHLKKQLVRTPIFWNCSARSTWRIRKSATVAFLDMMRWWRVETLVASIATRKIWFTERLSRSERMQKMSRDVPIYSTLISSGTSSKDSHRCKSLAWCSWEKTSTIKSKKCFFIHSAISYE